MHTLSTLHNTLLPSIYITQHMHTLSTLYNTCTLYLHYTTHAQSIYAIQHMHTLSTLYNECTLYLHYSTHAHSIYTKQHSSILYTALSCLCAGDSYCLYTVCKWCRRQISHTWDPCRTISILKEQDPPSRVLLPHRPIPFSICWWIPSQRCQCPAFHESCSGLRILWTRLASHRITICTHVLYKFSP